MGRVDSAGTGSVWNMFCPSDENIPELQKRLNKCTGNYYWKEGDDYCQDPERIRLAEGAHRCSGRLEIYFNKTWGTVCDDAWSDSGARVVCAQLGCGPLLNTLGEEGVGLPRGSPGSPIWLDEVECRGTEPTIWACRSAYWGEHDCHHKEDVQVNCTYLPEKDPVLGNDPFRDDLIPIVASIILAILLIIVTTVLIYQIYNRDKSVLGRTPARREDGIYEDIDYGRVKRFSKISHVSEATNSSASLNKIEYYVDGELQEEDGVLPEGYDDVDNGAPTGLKEYYDDVDRDGAESIELEVLGGGGDVGQSVPASARGGYENVADWSSGQQATARSGDYDDVENGDKGKGGSYENVPSCSSETTAQSKEPRAGDYDDVENEDKGKGGSYENVPSCSSETTAQSKEPRAGGSFGPVSGLSDPEFLKGFAVLPFIVRGAEYRSRQTMEQRMRNLQ
ncbi:uncharacterized protein LOC132808761 [Hemiscyllium ocellatum]|uniref:uncharacterized protein LOC132808761 n=1 Tax=Hemiscyllium ocellatum TaxID=170820 RepID=UPI00296687CD|nr:uncharacterized protein LOC132808761 [Hemiscyllium ocellatum]